MSDMTSLITKEDIEALVSKYNVELCENGITISISKKYFEGRVRDWRTIDRDYTFGLLYRKREKTFVSIPNRYRCVVLTVTPTDKNLLKKDCCKDYSFFISKIERYHTGAIPREFIFEKEKLVEKIEKRIKKILKKSSRVPAEKLCKDTWVDAMRYHFNNEYGYKKKFLYSDDSFWLSKLGLLLGALALAGMIFSIILISLTP